MTGVRATIGVLGGMGPEATILFMQKTLDAVRANDDADHVPLIVDHNTQVPSRIKALLDGEGDDPGPALAKMAERLQVAGADALAMPCNTAHFYARTITDSVSIPFLDMVQLSTRRAVELTAQGGRVGLLGSPALQATGVFENAMADSGIRAVCADDNDARLGIIRSIKKNGPSKQATDALQKAANRVTDLGADVVIVCCSEFSLIADRLDCDVPIFDTLDVLVDACVSFSNGKLPSSEAARRSSAASIPTKTDHQGKENLQC
ncbi:aspartate/glutamate racemase family protein [Hoeflea sp.]|uniref:aspartate/glutamate racemase family protein n=1 Tax=Hoeflea sp. TaxID=1940281 RepID=UPI003B0220AB